MARARTGWVLYGRIGTGARRSLPAVAVLFAASLAGSLAYHALLARLVAGWPRVNVASTVRVGSVAVPYHVVEQWVLLGVAVAGVVAAAAAASRGRGLLASLLFGAVPPLGYQLGSGAYYSLVFTDSLGALFGGVPFGVVVGIALGVVGYLVGRGSRAPVARGGEE